MDYRRGVYTDTSHLTLFLSLSSYKYVVLHNQAKLSDLLDVYLHGPLTRLHHLVALLKVHPCIRLSIRKKELTLPSSILNVDHTFTALFMGRESLIPVFRAFFQHIHTLQR